MAHSDYTPNHTSHDQLYVHCRKWVTAQQLTWAQFCVCRFGAGSGQGIYIHIHMCTLNTALDWCKLCSCIQKMNEWKRKTCLSITVQEVHNTACEARKLHMYMLCLIACEQHSIEHQWERKLVCEVASSLRSPPCWHAVIARGDIEPFLLFTGFKGHHSHKWRGRG